MTILSFSYINKKSPLGSGDYKNASHSPLKWFLLRQFPNRIKKRRPAACAHSFSYRGRLKTQAAAPSGLSLEYSTFKIIGVATDEIIISKITDVK